MPELSVYAAKAGDDMIMWASLAYRADLGRELGFANVSLGEDVDFADRAVRGCRRFGVVRDVPSMYTRHEGADLRNTYQFKSFAGMVERRRLAREPPPQWVTPALAALAGTAEADAGSTADASAVAGASAEGDRRRRRGDHAQEAELDGVDASTRAPSARGCLPAAYA